MEGNSWRPAAGEPSTAVDGASGDWRSQLQPNARQRIVNKIMDTIKRHLPISVPEGLSQLEKIAIQFAMQFEEKIYTAATNETDYLRRIYLRMLSMETKTQGTAAINQSLSNPSVGNQSPADSGTIVMQPQFGNQGQSLAMPLINQSQVRQPLVPQNYQNNSISTALQGSAVLATAVPSIGGFNEATMTNVGQTSNLQNLPEVSQNSVNTSAGQGVTQNIYTNAQRQIQGRQQQPSMLSQQQHQSQNQLICQQQLQQHILKQKMQHSLLQPHMQQQQQQQQSLLQSNQLQSSQQPLMQMASGLQTGQSTIQQTQPALMQSAPQPNLLQNQQNVIQQSMPSLLQQHPQSIARQQQAQATMHQQSSSLQQQSTSIPQQSVLHSQQQQLTGQQTNMSNKLQTQLLGQQNNVPDLQHQQQQRFSGQQNNLMSMQQPQQMLNRQTISVHQQQQLGQQNNISGLQQQQQQQHHQQQLLGSQSSVLSMQHHQPSMHVLQSTKTLGHQQNQHPSMTLLQSQGPQAQHQSSQQQLMSQIQSQPQQLQQQLAMQQPPNSLQREMQQRLQTSGVMLQSQNTIEPQKQFIQSQRGLQEVMSSPSVDSTAQTGHAGAVDWQEEIYQKVRSMKELYLAELSELHQKIALRFQQHEAVAPPVKQSGQFEKMKNFKYILERTIGFLQIEKSNIQPSIKEKIPLYEKQIMCFLSSNRSKKIAPSQQQGQQQFQHPSGHAQSMPQQQPSQVSQLQHHDNHVNQAKQMNLQGSVASMQSAPVPNIQHGSVLTHVTVPASQQNMANALQPASTLDPVQGNSFSSLQQGALGPMQQGGAGSLQNTINAPQQSNISTLSQSSVNTLLSNVDPLPPDSERPSGISTVTNAINAGHQQTALAPPQNQSLAVGTPGISASPLLAEFTSPEGSQVNASTTFRGKLSTTERPIKVRKIVTNPKEPTFTCPVCLNELVESCSTICGHIFCQGCIKMTVQKLKKCPMCTRALTMKNFHRVYLPTIEFNIDSP